MQESSALLELQAIDVEIIRANKRLEDLPEKRAILQSRAKQREITAMHEKADSLLGKLQSELKTRQDEMSMLAEKIGAEQTKIMETSDHRQVQSLTREMDGLRRRSDKLEMESLQYMERIEKVTSQIAKIDEALTTLAEKEAELVKQFQHVGGLLQKEIGGLEKKRAARAAEIDPGLLKTYEANREGKGGVGVGRLEGDSCSACRMSLPSERLKELTEGPDIGMCPQCRRLLVVRAEDGQ